MILIILRIVFGALWLACAREAWRNGASNLESGDLLNAYYTALLVLLAVANAIVWAPYVGDKISGPITGTITRSTYVERFNYLLKLVYWCQDRGLRRLAEFFCFLEGIHHPERPTAFVIGLKHAKPGSWLEKVFAREVFKFDNIQNAVQAYRALERHGIDPRPHHTAEVNVLLMSMDREVRPDPPMLAVPKADEPPLKRNRKIKLFDVIDQGEAKANGTPT